MALRASVLRVSMLNVLFHNDSRSATELFLGSDCLTVHTRVQSLSIVEDMPGLDQDGNGWLDDSECRVGQAAIVDRLFAGMEFGSLRVGKPAQAAVVLEERVRDGFGIDLYQWVSVQWVSRLEVIPEEQSLWHGECFVFDERVSVKHDLSPGSYDMCHACKRPITEEDKQGNAYVPGVSCPHCVDEMTPEQKRRFAERQKQINLARKRGEAHMGPEAAANRRREEA